MALLDLLISTVEAKLPRGVSDECQFLFVYHQKG